MDLTILDWMGTGARWWPKTYAFPIKSEGAFRRIEADPNCPSTTNDELAVIRVHMCAQWCDFGFPRLEFEHKHAAAMMCSTMPGDVLDALRPPWRAFVIDVPAGLIVDENGMMVSHMLVTVYPVGDKPGQWGVCADVRGSSPDVVFDDIGADSLSLVVYTEEQALDAPPWRVMLSRFMLGAIAEASMHRPCHYRERGASAVKRDALDPRNNPVTRTFKISRDVKIDCRETVRAACRASHKGSAPTVQVLVRGHWKRQPHGVARVDRKLIFVEPYWRGPEDAHIALRKHKIIDAAPSATGVAND